MAGLGPGHGMIAWRGCGPLSGPTAACWPQRHCWFLSDQATRWRGWGCKGDRLRALASCHLAARAPLGTQDVLQGPTNFQRALPPCSEASGPENSPEGEGATLAEDEPWLCSFNFKPQESKPKAAGSAPPAPQPSCPPPPPHPGQLAALRPRCSLGSPGCTGH